MSQVVVCDFCGKRERPDSLLGWLQIRPLGPWIGGFGDAPDEGEFCSKEHAARWLKGEVCPDRERVP